MTSWKVKIITSVTDIFPGPLEHSLIGRALKNKIWSLEIINLRDFAYDNRGSIDDSPYGGGPGMVIRPDVAEKALKKALENMETDFPLVYMTPAGKPLDQKKLKNFSKRSGVVILCGRYEGVDERILDAYNFEKISMGDYILPGGETAAIALVEGCVRLLPGVVGKSESLLNESFEKNILEHPHYTKPQKWIDQNKKEHKVPDVLTSGNHEEIKRWRKEKSLEKTKKIRPDLINKE